MLAPYREGPGLNRAWIRATLCRSRKSSGTSAIGQKECGLPAVGVTADKALPSHAAGLFLALPWNGPSLGFLLRRQNFSVTRCETQSGNTLGTQLLGYEDPGPLLQPKCPCPLSALHWNGALPVTR